MQRMPLVEPPPDVTRWLAQVDAQTINLYRALANAPDMLRAYLKMAWGLRLDARTPRALRELLILRGAQVAGSEYEQRHHLRMAREAGVPEKQIGALSRWREASVFTPPERAVLALAEELAGGSLSDETAADLASHFDETARVELILTSGFYVMLARVIDALGVPLEAELAAAGPADGARP